MAERPTARSTDRAARSNDGTSGLDSWIAYDPVGQPADEQPRSRRARRAANDADSYYEPQDATLPPHDTYRSDRYAQDRYEEAHQPRDTYEAYGNGYGQDRSYGQHGESYAPDEEAYGQPNQYASPETYQEGHRSRNTYGRREEYAETYPAQQQSYESSPHDGYAQHEQYGPPDGYGPHDEYAVHEQYQPPGEYGHGEYGHGEYGDDEYGAQDDDDSGRHRAKHSRELDARPRPANRRRLWLIPVGGLAVGVLLLCGLPLISGGSLPFLWDNDAPANVGEPVAAGTAPAEPDPTASLDVLPEDMLTIAPTSAASSPRNTPSTTPSLTPTPTPTPTPAVPTPPPQPVLLGPASNGGLKNMVEQYCDRHVSGGWAEARGDGRWQCDRFLSSARLVNMDVACADTYGSGAFARTSNGGDPYAWRCYRL